MALSGAGKLFKAEEYASNLSGLYASSFAVFSSRFIVWRVANSSFPGKKAALFHGYSKTCR